MSWYFTAAINTQNQTPQVEIHVSNEKGPNDLSISRNWMEYIEFQNTHGGPGAYDVLRCDLIKQKNSPTRHKVWGQDYHLQRLENSYKELVCHLLHLSSSSSFDDEKQKQCNLQDVANTSLKEAHQHSDAILNALLSKMIEHEQSHIQSEACGQGIVCEIIRVTLIWTPFFDKSDLQDNSSDHSNHTILVRGHASTSGQIMVPDQVPASIIATLALPNHASKKGGPSILEDLPDRHISPHAKISSWSSERRPLEKKETFMPDGVGEVLLLREKNTSKGLKFELLEGMTSNFFAIYQDGTLRTAPDGVLLGYVRHLVLECAPSCGLKVDHRPIDLDDGRNGLWVETFITSSSRLIYPIEKILIPEYDDEDDIDDDDDESKIYTKGLNWKVFWQTCDKLDTQECKWRQLLKEILQRGGY